MTPRRAKRCWISGIPGFLSGLLVSDVDVNYPRVEMAPWKAQLGSSRRRAGWTHCSSSDFFLYALVISA